MRAIFVLLLGALVLCPISAGAGVVPPQYTSSFGSAGVLPGQFQNPCAIGIGPSGEIWVLDKTRCVLQKFTADGVFVAQYGGIGSFPGQLRSPKALAIDHDGNVFVADTYNSRVQVFSAVGEVVGEWGTWGVDDGQFKELQGIGFDAGTGLVHVAERYNRRVQTFDSEGTFLQSWGGIGSGPCEFALTTGAGALAVGSDGMIYVLDPGNFRVEKMTPDGEYVATWGSKGFGPGKFVSPNGIAVGADGTVYVSDAGSHVVQMFNGEGIHLGTIGSRGSGPGQFEAPSGLAVDEGGRLYVADAGNRRVQVFSPPFGVSASLLDTWYPSLSPNLVVMMGTAQVDPVGGIDLASLRLNGVAPLRIAPFPRGSILIVFPGDPLHAQAIGGWLNMVLSGTSKNGTAFATGCLTRILDTLPLAPSAAPERMVASTPTSAGVVLRFTLKAPAPVQLAVYDVRGRFVERLLDATMPAGDQSVAWRANGVARGVYFYRLVAGEQIESGKIVVSR